MQSYKNSKISKKLLTNGVFFVIMKKKKNDVEIFYPPWQK